MDFSQDYLYSKTLGIPGVVAGLGGGDYDPKMDGIAVVCVSEPTILFLLDLGLAELAGEGESLRNKFG